MDIMYIWGYDLSWLIIIDLVKMAIIRIQDGPEEQATLQNTVSRQSFVGRREGSRVFSMGGSVYSKVRQSGSKRISKDIRISTQGLPMPPKTGVVNVSAPGVSSGQKPLW